MHYYLDNFIKLYLKLRLIAVVFCVHAINIMWQNMAERKTDFYYCPICRQSDIRGRKHVYSKKHQDRLKFVLEKFASKVKAAEVLLDCPEVIEGSYEKGSTYWCIFCSRDIPRHAQDGLLTVKLAMFIEHLCSDSHRLASTIYYRLHHGDPEKIKQRLVLSAEDYSRFKTKLAQALNQFENKSYSDLQESAAKIRRLEKERLQLAQETPSQAEESQSESSQGHSLEESSSIKERIIDQQQTRSRQILGRVRTIGVISSGGLTSIGTQHSSLEGNIHTGAPPPWLTSHSDDRETPRVIGPVAEDFQKHLEREKKRKLNPNRVGAKFDHVTPTSEEWLPSFGRVWNSGRRWQSRHQYRKEKKDEGKLKRKAPFTESKPP